MIQDKWLRVPLQSILVQRAVRQRKAIRSPTGDFLNQDGLLESIRARGVLNALIVEETSSGEFLLIAGERRYEASKELGIPDVPVRFASDLSIPEREVMELEENLKRTDLPWRDEVAAVCKLHELYCVAAADRGEKWSREATIAAVGYGQLTVALRVCRDLENPKIAAATHLRAAYNILTRIDDRATADAVNDIVDAAGDLFGGISDVNVDGIKYTGSNGTRNTSLNGPDQTAQADKTTGAESKQYRAGSGETDAAEQSILCADAIDFMRGYSGPAFNLIHCDFPYGTNVFGGTQANTQGGQVQYVDHANIYYTLIEELCAALPRLMSHSAHLMFWLSADIPTQWKTLELFRLKAPQLSFFRRMPLIWHKTDNVGILSDPRRGPRHIYETCLLASVEDRQIIRAVSDVYGAPTDKSHHPSCKPEPVLRHFFQMLCDEHTRIFDPTCGSGTSLRAAESLGACAVLGLEKDPEHCAAAQSALRSFRTLRKAAK
jgi:hypothetical protein